MEDRELVEIYDFWSESFYSWLHRQEKIQEIKSKLYENRH